ncbi:uncharacterized, partial [Tachysurus ichikawai]
SALPQCNNHLSLVESHVMSSAVKKSPVRRPHATHAAVQCHSAKASSVPIQVTYTPRITHIM